MEELRELASSAGAEVVDTVTQKLPKPTAHSTSEREKRRRSKNQCNAGCNIGNF